MTLPSNVKDLENLKSSRNNVDQDGDEPQDNDPGDNDPSEDEVPEEDDESDDKEVAMVTHRDWRRFLVKRLNGTHFDSFSSF